MEKLTLKLVKNKDFNWLIIWPFHPNCLKKCLRDSGLEKKNIYLPLAHKYWNEVFYPPKASEIRVSPLGKGELGQLETIEEFFEKSGYIDLKLYITENTVPIDQLKTFLLKGKHGKILKHWGGIIFHLHDSEKLYFDFINKDTIKKLFPFLIDISLPDKDDYNKILEKLESISDDKCLLVLIENGLLKMKVISSDVQKYELIEKL
jgi:hypothetical protein